ncbi:hypothetical protein B9G55_14935 [Saccharibacillus sp. O16]|nr:hypothetical protein B9G55_14935 [Saccharibacillus sp. O16]
MNKSERLQLMQRYAYRQRNFTLRQLMDEFGISRSTALRDIEALEALGLPLYADRGRSGGYRVLETASLPPVSFTTREVLALYLAIQTMRGLSDDALNVPFDSIHAKFLEVVSAPQRDQIEQFRHRIAFYPDEPAEAGACLETLLRAAVQGEVLEIRYAAPASRRSQQNGDSPMPQSPEDQASALRRIQPFAVYASRGFWYCRAYDLGKQEYRVFRCDRVQSAERTADKPVEALRTFDLRDAHTLRKPSASAIAFRCAVAPEAAAGLRRRLYPSMALSAAPEPERSEALQAEAAGAAPGEHLILSGHYEPQETDFIVSFLAAWGASIRILEPESLRDQLRSHYLRLIGAL